MHGISTTPTTPTTSVSELTGYRVRPGRAVTALGAAVAAGLLIWGAAAPLGGLSLAVVAAGRIVGPGSVTVAALLGGAAAWLLLALLGRRPGGRRRWTRVGILVLVLSLIGPVVSGAAGGVLLVLEGMHLLVGTVLILGLRRSAVPRSAAGRTVIAEAP